MAKKAKPLQLLADRLGELFDECDDEEELLRKIGVTHKTALDHYRAGRRVPKPEILLRLAETFDCSLDYLFGRTMVRRSGPPPKIDADALADWLNDVKDSAAALLDDIRKAPLPPIVSATETAEEKGRLQEIDRTSSVSADELSKQRGPRPARREK